ncbi:MAG: hypothetical protein KAR39_12090 [Thermoplasmata archaeon]|nr:hypothetical protein [Thermoplasmata archaeon]
MTDEIVEIGIRIGEILIGSLLASAIAILFARRIHKKKRMIEHSRILTPALRGLARLSFSGEALGFKMNRDIRNPVYPHHEAMIQHLEKHYHETWRVWTDVANRWDSVEKKIKKAYQKKQEGENIEDRLKVIELDRKALLKRDAILQSKARKVWEDIDAGGILKGKCDICKEF